MKRLITAFMAVTAAIFTYVADAQAMFFDNARVADSTSVANATAPYFKSIVTDTAKTDSSAVRSLAELHAALESYSPYDEVEHMSRLPLPRHFFMPSIYDTFTYDDTTGIFTPDFSDRPEMYWIEADNARAKTMQRIKKALFFGDPYAVTYNINLLPEAPKKFHAVLDPSTHRIEIKEIPVADAKEITIEAQEIKQRHWIRTFSASLQFSQAYVSPNWYQGGNNNLNMLANIYYNVKLNQKYHPKLLFETTAQYKLGMNSAPDDSIHNYSISDDLFQINTTFGLKAAKRWYYSLTAQFKTQIFNSYPSNSRSLRSAFLSPGELTAGIGMTYNYANAKKTFTFDASLAPISYSMKTCINDRIDPTIYNIDAGRKTSHNFGSSAELKLSWKISYNISFTSRLFAFTDYDSAQADWENKLSFDINRFLSTQLYVHARYDSSTPPCDDANWKKLQVKEILSIGFAYKFSTI